MKKGIENKKPARKSYYSESGAILPLVVILMVAVTMTGIALFNTCIMENQLVNREIAKNQAFYLADGGIEHLKVKLYHGESEPQISWTNLGNGSYEVEGFYSEDPPYAISTGRIIKAEKEILKRIRVIIHRTGIFDLGLFGDNAITLGSNVTTDSYDSDVGSYLITQSQEGDIGTNSTANSAIFLDSNSIVNGNATIGPGGDVETAINVNSNAQINGERIAASSEKELPLLDASDVPPLPDRGSLFLGGSDTATISDSGRYSSLVIDSNALLTINQDVTLYVQGELRIDSNAQLRITGGVDVTIYVGGNVSVKSNGIVNESSLASNFSLIGLDTCNAIELNSNVDFYGVVYAPTANIEIHSNADLYGSVVGSCLLIDGNAGLHYDKALANDFSMGATIKLEDWQELS